MTKPTNEKIEDTQKRESKNQLKKLIDGSVFTQDYIVNRLPYFFFVTVLALIYIANHYHSERIARKTIKLQYELKELRAESITTASKLMFISKQSQVVRLVNEHGLGLKEAVEPPKKIIIKLNE